MKSKISQQKLSQANKTVPVTGLSVLPKKLSSRFGPIVYAITTIALALIAQIFASVVLLGLLYLLGYSKDEISKQVTSLQLWQFVFVAIADSVIIFFVWRFLKVKQQNFKDIGFVRPTKNDFVKAIVAYVVYMIILVVATALVKVLVPSVDLEQSQQLGFEANKGLLNLIFAGISLVILPPLTEELLYRGYLFTGLRKTLKFLPAAVVTSLIFAMPHLQFNSGAPLLWAAAIDTFILSLILVYLRENTKSLAAPIIVHAIKNGLAFSILFIFAK